MITDVPAAIGYEEVFATVFGAVGDVLVVPNLGTNTAMAMALRPTRSTLYLWGGMGLTQSLGLGVAIACPDRTVVVLDGDGSLLMGLSGLATIGVERPANLLHVVLDNRAWGNTGGQPTHTAHGVRLEEVASGCGYPRAYRVEDVEALTVAMAEYVGEPRCTMLVVPVPYVHVGRATSSPQPVLIKHDFISECQREQDESMDGGRHA